MKLHSTMPLVTNSSTTIRTMTTENSVRTFHTFVNTLLAELKMNVKSEDIFDVKIVPGENDWDIIIDEYEGWLEDDYPERYDELYEKIKDMSWVEKWDFKVAMCEADEEFEYSRVYEMENELLVKNKNGEVVNVGALYGMFYHEEVYS